MTTQSLAKERQWRRSWPVRPSRGMVSVHETKPPSSSSRSQTLDSSTQLAPSRGGIRAKPKRKNNVVRIDATAEPDATKPRFIARDAQTHRVILGIGSERYAMEITTRMTKLPPGTGDAPAPVVPLKKPPER